MLRWATIEAAQQAWRPSNRPWHELNRPTRAPLPAQLGRLVICALLSAPAGVRLLHAR